MQTTDTLTLTINTRRYPRTTAEAFPHTADYACAIERPMDHADRVVFKGALAVAVVLFVLLATGVI